MTHVPHRNLALAAQLLEPSWRTDAACRASVAADFFAPAHLERKPEKDRREESARATCSSCPVRQPCLDYALLVQEPHGIWGGLTELERRRVLRARRAAGTAEAAGRDAAAEPVAAG